VDGGPHVCLAEKDAILEACLPLRASDVSVSNDLNTCVAFVMDEFLGGVASDMMRCRRSVMRQAYLRMW
jgi:hypothetical protein